MKPRLSGVLLTSRTGTDGPEDGMLKRILRALSRVTSGGQVIPVIDGLRFLAISSVVMVHLLSYVIDKSPVTFTLQRMQSLLGAALDRGWVGVQLFFLISGFVICLPFAMHHLEGAKPVSLKSYYLRRLTRLEPPYFVCITLLFLLLILVKGESFAAVLPHYLSTVTYSHNIVYGYRSTIAAVTWSLEIEIQFYLMAPLVAHLFVISNKAIRRGLLIALIVGACALQPLLQPTPDTVLKFIQFFLTGFLLADIYIADWRRAPSLTMAMDGVALAAIAALYWISGNSDRVNNSPFWGPLACLSLLLLAYTGFRGHLFSRFLSMPWIAAIGGMCYTIYLYHEQILSLIGHATIRVHATRELWVNYWLQWCLMIPAMLVIASLLFVYLEKPFMRREWPQRLKARLLGASGDAALVRTETD
jgi:peptidoglycan/LPS O-acetylase OafA/YrhL